MALLGREFIAVPDDKKHQIVFKWPDHNIRKYTRAIVNADQGLIKIYNFSNQAIREADVWVNQAFVRHINAIPPGSSITLQMSNLYNGVGQQFSQQAEHVNTVQVQTDHDMQTLWGPAPQ